MLRTETVGVLSASVHLCKPLCTCAHTHTRGGSRCHSQLVTPDRDDHPVCRAIRYTSVERWRDDEGGEVRSVWTAGSL